MLERVLSVQTAEFTLTVARGLLNDDTISQMLGTHTVELGTPLELFPLPEHSGTLIQMSTPWSLRGLVSCKLTVPY